MEKKVASVIRSPRQQALASQGFEKAWVATKIRNKKIL